MLDKLEVRLPATIEFRKPIAELVDGIRRGQDVPGFQRRFKGHYSWCGDLRPHGENALLHLQCRRGRGDHKLEMLETGKTGRTQILAQIEDVVSVNPERLETMRFDCTVNVPNVPVTYFQRFARVRFRRWASDIGAAPMVQYSRMGMGEPQTLYWGKHPNCLRIYNKTAEYQGQYREACRVHKALPSALLGQLMSNLKNTGVPELDGMSFPDVSIATLKRLFPERVETFEDTLVPTFEEVFGISEDTVLTRIERQISADRVPEDMNVLKTFWERLPSFNPFEHLVIERGSTVPDPVIPTEIRGRNYLVILGLRKLIEEQGGMQFARAELNRRSSGNAAKLIDKYAQYLPAETSQDGRALGVTENQLLEMYQDSITRQLAA